MARLDFPAPDTPEIATTSPGTSSRSTDLRLWVSAPSRMVRSIWGERNVEPRGPRRKGTRGRTTRHAVFRRMPGARFSEARALSRVAARGQLPRARLRLVAHPAARFFLSAADDAHVRL